MSKHYLPAFVLVFAALAGAQQPRGTFTSRFQADSLAPYVPSPEVVVDKMLEAADIKAGEMLFDLGCGDGRIPIRAAQQFKARGVCVELSEELVRQAREQVAGNKLEDHVQVVHNNLLKVDLRPADVVTVYLLTSSNEKLRPILEKSLKPGARVVSHDFVIRGWQPNRVETVEATGRTHTIYVYRMPPKKD